MQPFNITEEFVGLRLDQFVATQHDQYSRTYWSAQIKQGLVMVNDKVCTGKYRLIEGDCVQISANLTQHHGDAAILIPQDIPLNIIYETEHYCVLNKAAGCVVHPGAGVSEGTLANGLIYAYPACQNLPNWGLVHRLDKDTTGLMVVAKSLEGYCDLNTQMLAREISRKYRALVMGRVRMPQTITSYLSRDPKNRLKKRSSSYPAHGKIAITHITILNHYKDITEIQCVLETGRTHQIRVQLESIGHPIIGEPLYSNHPRARGLFHRQALHAEHLSLREPGNSIPTMMHFVAPIPDDFEQLIASLS